MPESIKSKEVSLANLMSDVTADIRNQIKDQEILSIPLPEYRDENYIGNAGLDSIENVDKRIAEVTNTKNMKHGLLSSLSFKLFKESTDMVNKGVIDTLSLRVGESPVLNPPWQFNELDDVRSNIVYPHMGRVYLTYIYSNFPILVFKPGRQKMNVNILSFFTKTFGVDHAVLNSYIRSGGNGIMSKIKMALVNVKNTTLGILEGALTLLGADFANASKFITFKPAMKLYQQMANNLLREFAANLGLLDLSREKYSNEAAFDIIKDNSDIENSEMREYMKSIQFGEDNDYISGSGENEEKAVDELKRQGEKLGISPDDVRAAMSYNSATDKYYGGKESSESTIYEPNEPSDFDKILDGAKNVLSNLGDVARRAASTYRGSFPRLDVLEMIPHIVLGSNDGLGKDMSAFFGDVENRAYLPYLCQSNISISETFSNSTKEHPVVGQINAMSEEAADAKGLGGVGKVIEGARSLLSGGEGTFDRALSRAFKEIGMKLGGDIISKTNEMGMIVNGDGKMLIPEIWASSSYSRSYSIEFKFWSPTGDIVSIFENTYIPYLLLMVLASPLQTGYQSYASPFIIKVLSKGLFSIDMGIIESLSITRGDGANDRTRDNFPRSIKVSVSVKDLSPVMMLSLGNGAFWKYRRANSSLSEYIATMCNVSIAERYDLARKFDIYWSTLTSSIRDKFSLNNIGYNFANSFLMKPLVAWNRNKVTIDITKTKNIYY